MITVSMMRPIVARVSIMKKRIPGSKKTSRLHATSRFDHISDLDTVPSNESLYILVFKYGSDDKDGLYSIEERSKDDIPVNSILAFSSHDDATRYGALLHSSMGQIPSVEMVQSIELRYTCDMGGYKCKVVPHGGDILPPKKTVDVLDCERVNALRNGQWSVLLDDPINKSVIDTLNRIFYKDP